jgi:hypothetical protein
MNRMGGKQKKSVMLTYLCERLGVFFVFWVRTSWQFQYVNVSFVLFKKKKKKRNERGVHIYTHCLPRFLLSCDYCGIYARDTVTSWFFFLRKNPKFTLFYPLVL